MSFYNLLTNTVCVSRLTALSADKFAFSTVTAEADVCIQRLRDEKAIAAGGAVGKSFRLYCATDTDIQEGDKLVDEDSKEYKVLAITKPAELGAFVHREAVIILIKGRKE